MKTVFIVAAALSLMSCAHGEKKRFGYGTIVSGMTTDKVIEQMDGRGPSEIRTSSDGVTVWKYREQFCFGFKDGKLISKDEPTRIDAIDLFIFFSSATLRFPNCNPSEPTIVEKHTNVLLFFNFSDRVTKAES
jgi:hypothetical protein